MSRRTGLAVRGARRTAAVDPEALERELRVRTGAEVRFDAGARGAYSTDASNYRQIPIGVVVPRSEPDVVAAVEVCRDLGAPIVPRGGGTSLAGQCCNVAVVIDFSKYLNRVLEVDPAARTATVQPGVVLDALRAQTEPHDLTFGPDPATHSHCTLGGMIGNNSCGIHSVLAGRTADNVLALDVVTSDGEVMTFEKDDPTDVGTAPGRRGEILRALRDLRDDHAAAIRARFPDIPRRVSGYDLPSLLPERGFDVPSALVGSEGTCVVVLRARVRLVEWPRARTLVALGYPDVFAAADDVTDVMSFGPIGLEGIDAQLVDLETKKHLGERGRRLLPDGHGWLLVEFGGEDKDEADERAREMISSLERRSGPPTTKMYDDPDDEHYLWLVRENGLGATARIPGRADAWPGWEDSAVAPEKLGAYLRDLHGLFDEYGYSGALYGHFGQGCVHTRIDFDLTSAGGIATFRRFLDDASDVCLRHGGSLSGEHGDGQARGELLEKMFGAELVGSFERFKEIWDPDGRMNPGKVVRADPITSNLRLGADYRPWEPQTHFRYPDDDGRFSRAALRCVGVGKCRRDEGGTMCPSYMVTREEIHSTRGRARLLFEMLQGDVVDDGWRSDAVREALDLCLACKGCLNDCPVNVDMATYKSEFLAHHYAGRLRPAAHYAMGLLPYAARAASLFPGAVNALAHAPGLAHAAKRAAGLAPEREIPRFAPQTLQRWFRRRAPRSSRGERVLLWPDTFTNHFHPSVGRAAVGALESLGFDVVVPSEPLCCGLTAITNGLLPTAKRMLRRTLDVLGPHVARGTPVVGLEPSCTAVFRHDLVALLPDDERAQRLRGATLTFAELLTSRGVDVPTLDRDALVHAHCHHAAVMHMDADHELFERMGVRAQYPESGCCGLAGSFGFERGHYDVSLAAGERVLLPAVRGARADELIVTDGFSCRTQIGHATRRRALHTAEVVDMALRVGDPGASPRMRPESAYPPEDGTFDRRSLALAGTASAALGAWIAHRRRMKT